MLRNYLIIAWKGLLRHKFVTAVSLLGIGMTLMVLTVLVAYLESFLGNTKPEVNRSRSLYITQMTEKGVGNGTSTSSVSYFFLTNHVVSLQSPEAVSISSHSAPLSVQGKDGKIKCKVKYTDAAFWQVNDFNFLAGRNFTKDHVNNDAHVVVICHSMARTFFDGEPDVAIGQEVVFDNKTMKVVGVVEDPLNQGPMSFSEMWVPVSLSRQSLSQTTFKGGFTAQILARSSSDFQKILSEYEYKMSQVSHPDKNSIKSFNAPMVTHQQFALKMVSYALFNRKPPGALTFYSVLTGLVLLIMFIPAINLININSGRIRERLSEIGIRKAFGASGRSLIVQFLTENIFLCILGGLVGLVFSIFSINFLNQNNVFHGAYLSVNFNVFFIGFLLTILFGLLSGVIPAYKMSRLQIVNVLKKQRS